MKTTVKLAAGVAVIALAIGNAACAASTPQANDPPASAAAPSKGVPETPPGTAPLPTPTNDPSVFKPPATGDTEIIEPPPASASRTPVIKPPENPPPNPAPANIKPKPIGGLGEPR